MREYNHPLLEQIQKKREEMIAIARETGLSSNETILCSQELDKLIYKYQALVQKDQQRNLSKGILFCNLQWLMYKFNNPMSTYEA
ncbi:aspartyl-phosphate phosphatase Spo0E family protein [Mesobacillus foraminis]|uniref:aspartyl-phosphate phosphatase Spo0E family protein n=1 Tax=Mesobacillus foraminis TaxID=279826 RepID=UPI0039A151B1